VEEKFDVEGKGLSGAAEDYEQISDPSVVIYDPDSKERTDN
jgi:hypothetical protein